MLKSARRIKAAEASDLINLHAIPLTNAKYVEELRDFYRQEQELLSGFDPNDSSVETKREQTDEEMKQTAAQVMGLFAMRKRLHGI